jgi:hypothetical protein
VPANSTGTRCACVPLDSFLERCEPFLLAPRGATSMGRVSPNQQPVFNQYFPTITSIPGNTSVTYDTRP